MTNKTRAYVIVLIAMLCVVPLFTGEYWSLIATRMLVFWVIVSGLNLIIGFAGQLAIGYVAVLAIGAYTASILVAHFDANPFIAMGAAIVTSMLASLVVGVPALRLTAFYFAVATLGAAQIVTQVALAWKDVTGGGIGLPGPALPGGLGTTTGLYLFCLAFALLSTWLTSNIAFSRFGRALIATRDADVAAETCGILKSKILLPVLLLAGALAGIAGSLYASLQSYITPEAFSFNLSVFLFICVLVGGRGSVVGPMIATVILTVLPEFAAPLAEWSGFLYAALLLAIPLLVPGGIAELLHVITRPKAPAKREEAMQPALIQELLSHVPSDTPLQLNSISVEFGALKAIDQLSLELRPGEIHGLIGPNGSGKTTTLNTICGFVIPAQGSISIGGQKLPVGRPQSAGASGIARTFQTPRVIAEATVLDNVLVGATLAGSASFLSVMLGASEARREEVRNKRDGLVALRMVGLEALAEFRADRLTHSELRLVEIARALLQRPRFLLLDEPAAGLTKEEIERLAGLMMYISRHSKIGILLVEHHVDLIFKACDRITALDVGRPLVTGTSAEIRVHKGVMHAYLGTA